MVFAAYAPVAGDTFIWDDDAYVTHNPTLRSIDGLRMMWFEPRSLPQYYPLVHTTFWIEYHLWGLAPLGYHADNVLLHAASVILLWRLLVRLQVPGAWLAAAIFGVHPVMVESVCWITERKNVLSLVFALLSMHCYLRFSPAEDFVGEEGETPRTVGRWWWYAAALVLFVAALLSKTVVATMPAVLAVIYWWKRGRIPWREVMPLLPFFLIGIGLGLYTARLERIHVGAEGEEWSFTPLARVLIAGRAPWFYASKLLLPYPLIFFYPRWDINEHVWWQYLFPAAALATDRGAVVCAGTDRTRAAGGRADFRGSVVSGVGLLERLPVPLLIRGGSFSIPCESCPYRASGGNRGDSRSMAQTETTRRGEIRCRGRPAGPGAPHLSTDTDL